MAGKSVSSTGNNIVFIDGEAASGEVHEFGAGADQLAFSGGTGASVIDLGAGNNRLTILGGGIDSGASVTADRGNDSLLISQRAADGSATGTAIDGSVDLGAGNNTVVINAGIAVAAGDTLATGAGTDNFTVNGAINGAITMGDGKNAVKAGVVDNNGEIGGGSGADSVTVSNAMNGEISLGDGANAASLLGGMSGGQIRGGTGVDTVTLYGSVAGAGNTIALGDGANVLKMGEGRFGGAGADYDISSLTVTGGIHNDNLLVDGYNKDDGASGDAADLVVNAGDGKNSLTLANLTLGDGSAVNTGAGDDLLNISAADGTAGAVSISSGAGRDTLTLGAMTDGVSVQLGAGDDKFILNSAVMGDDGEIYGGDGLDSLSISGIGAGALGDIVGSADVQGMEVVDLVNKGVNVLSLDSAALAKFTEIGADGLSGITTFTRSDLGLSVSNVVGTLGGVTAWTNDRIDRTPGSVAALDAALQREIAAETLLRVNGDATDAIRLVSVAEGDVGDHWFKAGAFSGYDVWASNDNLADPATRLVLIRGGKALSVQAGDMTVTDTVTTGNLEANFAEVAALPGVDNIINITAGGVAGSAKKITVKLGDGNNEINAAAGDSLKADISAGSGDDALDLGNIGALGSNAAGTKANAVTINLGNGSNELDASSMIGGSYAGGAGDDAARFTAVAAHKEKNDLFQNSYDKDVNDITAKVIVKEVELSAGDDTEAEIAATVNAALNAALVTAAKDPQAGMFYSVETYDDGGSPTGDAASTAYWVYGGQVPNPDLGLRLDSDLATAEIDDAYATFGEGEIAADSSAGEWFLAPKDAGYLGSFAGDAADKPADGAGEAGQWYINTSDNMSYSYDDGTEAFIVDGTAKTAPTTFVEWHYDDVAGEWQASADGYLTPATVTGWTRVEATEAANYKPILDILAATGNVGMMNGGQTAAVAEAAVAFKLGEGDNEVSASMIAGGSITAGAGNDKVAAEMLRYVGNINLGNGHNRVELGLGDTSPWRDGDGDPIMDGGTPVVTGGDAAISTNITLGTGDDVLTSGASLNAVNLKFGEGNNVLRIEDSFKSSTLRSAITMGAGHDYVDISTAGAFTTGNDTDLFNPEASALDGTSLNVGNGNNVVELEGARYGVARSAAEGKTAARAASLSSGTGDDEISVTGGFAAVHDAAVSDAGGDNTIAFTGGNALVNAAVKLGRGADMITLEADDSDLIDNDIYEDNSGARTQTSGVSGAAADPFGNLFDEWLTPGARPTDKSTYEALEGVGIYGGGFSDAGGDNSLNISADTIGIMGNVQLAAASGSVIGLTRASAVALTGNGANVVNIDAGYYGMYGGALNLGSGADTVNVIAGGTSGTNDGERAALAFNSQLNIAGGNNKVTLEAFGADAYALRDSSVKLGAGNDSVTLAADGDVSSWAMYAADKADSKAKAQTFARLDAGAGNDDIELQGNLQNAQLLAGAGADRLSINADMTTTGLNTIDLGAGQDTLAVGKGATNPFKLDLNLAGTAGATNKNTLKGIEIIKIEGDDAVFEIDDIAVIAELNKTVEALPGGELKGKKILRIDGNDTPLADGNFATVKLDTGAWTVAGSDRIDGREYNLLQSGSGKNITQLLVEKTVAIADDGEGTTPPNTWTFDAQDLLFTRNLTDAGANNHSFTTAGATSFLSDGVSNIDAGVKQGYSFGAGADKITLALTNGEDGLIDSWLDLGAGNNSLTVSGYDGEKGATAFGGSDETSVIRAGAGADMVAIANVVTALDGARMELGDGANRVNIAADAALANGALLYTGAGIDAINIVGGVAGGSVIDSGAGNDTLLVDELNDASKIVAGSGNDKLTLGEANGTDATHRALVELGAGNDSLFMTAGAAYSRLDGGSGLDTLNVADAGSVVDLTAGLNSNEISGLEILDLTNRAANVLDLRGTDLYAFTNIDADGLSGVKFGEQGVIASLTGFKRDRALAADWTDEKVTDQLKAEIGAGTLLRLTGEKADYARLIDGTKMGTFSGHEVWMLPGELVDHDSEATTPDVPEARLVLVKGATSLQTADVNWWAGFDKAEVQALEATNVLSFAPLTTGGGDAAVAFKAGLAGALPPETTGGAAVAVNLSIGTDGSETDSPWNADTSDEGRFFLTTGTGAELEKIAEISFRPDGGKEMLITVIDAETFKKLGNLTLGTLTGAAPADPTDPETRTAGKVMLDFSQSTAGGPIDLHTLAISGETHYTSGQVFGAGTLTAAQAKIVGTTGSDVLTLAGIGNTSRAISVDLGEGNNELNLLQDADQTAGTNQGFLGNATVRGGAGDDAVNVDGAVTGILAPNGLSISKTASLNLGAGDNSLTVGDGDFGDGGMDGGSYTGLGGDDTVTLEGNAGMLTTDGKTFVKGSGVAFNMGDGDNSLKAANMYGGTYTGTNGDDRIDILASTSYGAGGYNDTDTLGDIGALGATGGSGVNKDLLKLAAGTNVALKLGAGDNELYAQNMYGGSITGLAGGDSLVFNGDLGALDGNNNNKEGTSTDSDAADDRKLAVGSNVAVNLGDGNNSLKAANMYGGSYTGTNGDDDLVFTGASADGGLNNGDIGALGTAGSGKTSGLLQLAANSNVAIKLGNGDNSVEAGNMYGGAVTGGTGSDDLIFTGNIGALDGNNNNKEAPSTGSDAADDRKLAARTNVAVNLGDGDNSLRAANFYGGSYTGTNGDDRIDILASAGYDAGGSYSADTLGDLGALATGTSGATSGRIVLAANTGVAVKLGNGGNLLYAQNMYGGSIAGGKDADKLYFNGDIGALDGDDPAQAATTVAAASAKTTITLGDGDNELKAANIIGAAITGGKNVNAITVGDSIQSANITLGAGANNLIVGDTTDNDGLITGRGKVGSKLVFGNGVSSVTINGGGGAGGADGEDALVESSLTFGSGNDNLTVTGSLASAKIVMGAGDDSLTLNSSHIAGFTSKGADTAIDLGAGNDTLKLTAVSFFGNGSDTTANMNLVKGGAGMDTLNLGELAANGEDLNSGKIVFSALNQVSSGTKYSLAGFERIELGGDETTQVDLVLGAADVKNLGLDASLSFYCTNADGNSTDLRNGKALFVTGDVTGTPATSDIVTLGDGLAGTNMIGTTHVGNVKYDVYSNDSAMGKGNYLMVQSGLVPAP